MFKYIIVYAVVLSLAYPSVKIHAQAITILTEKKEISFRGLSVINDSIFWVSGSHGTIGRTVNGGKDWQWTTINTFPNMDFRDIHAFDVNHAIIMSVENPAILLKTNDGGQSWQTVLKDTSKEAFFDAMDFDGWNGILLGDPITNHFFIAETKDSGNHWNRITATPLAEKGEAFFASSGTNVGYINKKVIYASGGSNARLFYDKKIYTLKLQHGGNKKIAGAHGIAINKHSSKNSNINGIIVGGDYENKYNSDSNCVLIQIAHANDGLTLSTPTKTFKGYKSAATFLTPNIVISTGTSGSDISYDSGIHWNHFSEDSYNVCQSDQYGHVVIFAGGNGKIGILRLNN